MPNIDTAKGIVQLRNLDRGNNEEEAEYYRDFYNIELSTLSDLFYEVAHATYSVITEDNIESIGLAWFLLAYEIGRSHQSVINDIGDDEGE